MSKKVKIYLDTSVISCLQAFETPERMADTLRLWRDLEAGIYDVVISDITIDEN
jgi:predicted nucleic acid-binding protein